VSLAQLGLTGKKIFKAASLAILGVVRAFVALPITKLPPKVRHQATKGISV